MNSMKINIPIESLRRFRKQVFTEYQTKATLQQQLDKQLGKSKMSYRFPWDLGLIQTEDGNFILN